MVQELLSSQHPYDCCDDTLINCLKEKPTCRLVIRLANNICWRVAQGQEREKIIRAMSRRARSMLSTGTVAKMDISGFPAAGIKEAPVVLVEYACARCPYCSKVTPEVYNAVIKGPLKEKAKLVFKPFPIRSHPFSKESGLAFMAAAQMGLFWDYVLYFYDRFDDFCVKKQAKWAEAIGMDRKSFETLMVDPEIQKRLLQSKKEGIVNKVGATPTFFINGRKYVGDLNIEELIDVVEEEYERVKGMVYKK